MCGLMKWRWHQFYHWLVPGALHQVVSAAWTGDAVLWTCSCRKRFRVGVPEVRRG